MQVLIIARSARAVQTDREQARRVRRESLGLGGLTTPNEFLCPITQDVMLEIEMEIEIEIEIEIEMSARSHRT